MSKKRVQRGWDLRSFLWITTTLSLVQYRYFLWHQKPRFSYTTKFTGDSIPYLDDGPPTPRHGETRLSEERKSDKTILCSYANQTSYVPTFVLAGNHISMNVYSPYIVVVMHLNNILLV